jgi:hypothetical protein
MRGTDLGLRRRGRMGSARSGRLPAGVLAQVGILAPATATQ